MATMEVDPRLERRFERAPTGPSVIEFRGVSKTYEGGDVGLDGATFTVARGALVFLVGRTVPRKSTTMRSLLKNQNSGGGIMSVTVRYLGARTRRKVPYYRR